MERSQASYDSETLEEEAVEASKKRPYKDKDGVEGKLELTGKWPYRKLYFNPTAKGKRHPKYLEIKAQLHDDHSTDVSDSAPETWVYHIEHALRRKLK